MKTQRDQWIHFWTAEQPLLKHKAQIDRLVVRRSIIGNAARSSLFFSENGRAQMYVTERGMKDMERDGKKLLQARAQTRLIRDIQQTIVQSWRLTKRLRGQCERGKSLHRPIFVRLFEQYHETFLTIFAYVLSTWEPVSHFPERALKRIVLKHFSHDVDEVIRTIATPSTPNLLLQEKISLLRLKRRWNIEAFQRHMIRFSFLFTNIDQERDAVALMRRRIKNANAKILQEEIRTSRQRLYTLAREQEHILRKLRSAEAQRLAFLLQQLALLRLQLKNCWAGIHYSLFPLFSHIAREIRASIRDVMMFWSMDDILLFLRDHQSVSVRTLAQRRDFYLLYMNGRKHGFFAGAKARAMQKRLLCDTMTRNVRTITGVIANKGRAIGIVRIIDFDDLRVIEKVAQSITKPFVLITGMTNPNMMSLIKKAKAIVTDEGGITCHAAIISREMNIPCIIATRIATQILKDGDRVEVDAVKGIVRKLN